MVLLAVLNQEWYGGALTMPATGSGSGFSPCMGMSRRCGSGLLGKGLLMSQQGQGWWFRGEICLVLADHCSCKDAGTEKGRNRKMRPRVLAR